MSTSLAKNKGKSFSYKEYNVKNISIHIIFISWIAKHIFFGKNIKHGESKVRK